MKKKILISLVACFIAAGSFIGYNLTENTSRLDVSLADISVMAQADGEHGGGTAYCCPHLYDCQSQWGYLCMVCGGSFCVWVMNATEGCGSASTCPL